MEFVCSGICDKPLLILQVEATGSCLLTYSFDGKSVFISGGAGSLGTALVQFLLKSKARRIVVFDNNQSKLSELERRLDDPRLRFFVGDVRDLKRLTRGIEGCEVAFHCAALKIIPSCEYNPADTIKTNVLGSQNFVEACLDTTPDICVGISTDKACLPLNLYGATKLCMERLFIAANRYKGSRKTTFTCVRYGNVLGSAESVIPVWNEQATTGKIRITSPDMTRFTITMDQALDFIFNSMSNALGSEIFVPKLKSYTVRDLATAFLSMSSGKISVEEIGTRIGEKDHELLINEHEMKFAYELPFGYVILPPEQAPYPDAMKITKLTEYSSENVDHHTPEQLVQILKSENLLAQ